MSHKNGKVIECLFCKQKFYIPLRRYKTAKFCSKLCKTTIFRKKIFIFCQICNKQFFTIPSRLKRGLGKYCSPKCYNQSKLGKTTAKKGKKFPQCSGKNNPSWKGTDANYQSIHCWLRRNFKHPIKCQHCGKEGENNNSNRWSIQWALKKNKQHSHDPNNYLHLCYDCHKIYDRKN